MWIYLAILTIAGFAAMGADKARARARRRRIPERTLWLIALVGGSLGTYAGMYVFRHKTLKRVFSIGMPTLVLLQIGLGLFIYEAF